MSERRPRGISSTGQETAAPGKARPASGPPKPPTARPAVGAPKAPPTPPVTPPRASRRPDMIRQRREERLQLQERQQRQRLLTWIGAAAVALLVVGVAAFAIVSTLRDRQARQPPAGVVSFPDPGAGHVDGPVAYAEVPPVGGEHSPVWQNCGYYPAPVANETAVHSLEHGAVWITYRPDLPQDQVDVLRGLAENQTYVLVSPYPDLPAPVVASTWGEQLRLDSATSPDLAQFVRAFKHGPRTPEPGAACSGGTSEVA